MIDVHCHLQFHSFNNDFDDVAKQSFKAGVTRIINVGTKLDSSQKAIEFAEKYPEMYAIVGVHPHHADKIETLHVEHGTSKSNKKQGNWIDELEQMARHQKVVGIGEIGLDYFRYKSNGIVEPAVQKEIFEKQIELSHKVKLPLQIHNRQAGEDVLEILKHHKNNLNDVPGMFHCFAGSIEIVRSALDLGFYIGFDGNVTYNGIASGETTDLKDLARYVPLDRMVVETDSPFLTPIPYRGKRNTPANVTITGKFLAELKSIPYSVLVDQTTDNVYNIFGKLR
jgi:TatD DNase family protein